MGKRCYCHSPGREGPDRLDGSLEGRKIRGRDRRSTDVAAEKCKAGDADWTFTSERESGGGDLRKVGGRACCMLCSFDIGLGNGELGIEIWELAMHCRNTVPWIWEGGRCGKLLIGCR